MHILKVKKNYLQTGRTQYLQSMFSTHHNQLDNNRYPDINWTDSKEVPELKVRLLGSCGTN